MQRTRTRLKDIAVATGYSANTVSLALRGSPRIPEETRDRIQSAARSLNYFPNTIAQALVSRETRTIGLILTDIMNPTLTLVSRSLERDACPARLCADAGGERLVIRPRSVTRWKCSARARSTAS